MITNKKATTVRSWFRRLTAARLILLLLTCPPVWGKSPQTVSIADLMNMEVSSASKKELKIIHTAPAIYMNYMFVTSGTEVPCRHIPWTVRVGLENADESTTHGVPYSRLTRE